jgi:NAD-dependent deacetylase
VLPGLKMKNLVILSGAGISAESGLKTFRDMNGLWENYSIEEVATPEAWRKNPSLVLKFYNERRKQAHLAQPNMAHIKLAELQGTYNVNIITQNVDGLHEKAGSKNILHLHGELSKARSEKNENLIYEIGSTEIKLGDKAEDNYQLRPHIVWFGEPVPLIEKAAEITSKADVLVIIGTSLAVYPAAGLVNYVRKTVPVYVIDPNLQKLNNFSNKVTFIQKNAVEGIKDLLKYLEIE